MIGRTAALGVVVLGSLGVCFMAYSHRGSSAEAAAGPTSRPAGVAVVELFTSQGCSSCPPAEQVLGDLARAANQSGRPIFTLAFHVDYWNQLGWADPFSNAVYSRRQEQYARAFGSGEIYTPQMIVNGRKQFVGSDRDAADRAIADALAVPAAAQVKLMVQAAGREGYNVRVGVAGGGADAVVNVAVVERDLSTEVKAGENQGSKLEAPSVVRWFTTVSRADANEVKVPALADVRPGHASLVVYVQRPGNGPILGAAAAELP